MIIVTGAAGFIGSCVISKLHQEGHTALIAVDDFSDATKNKNLENLAPIERIDRMQLESWLAKNGSKVSFIFHLGARTDTTSQDKAIFDKLNLNYSKMIWKAACAFQIPLVYASSAATYGNGKLGYDDFEDRLNELAPLNPYAISKNDFDIWALRQQQKPPFWAGLKFFNVFGPNEYHKSRMASVVFHCYNQIKQNNEMRLFMSHKAGIANGEQKRDFVYVKDVVDVCLFLLSNQNTSGLFNLGTGQARSFNDLANATFSALHLEPNITYIPTPVDIRDSYQYFTEANMRKLRNAGYDKEFYSLENAIFDYVTNYLKNDSYY